MGTVRSRLHRARKKLREALGGSDPTAPDDGTDEQEKNTETEESARG